MKRSIDEILRKPDQKAFDSLFFHDRWPGAPKFPKMLENGKKGFSKAFRSSDVKTVCPAKTKKRDIFFATTAGRGRGRRASLHATRTHARTQRARTNSRRTPHRPNPPLPDEPHVLTRPVCAPSEPSTWSFAKCLGATPECECTFSEHRPALGALAREPTRGADPREGGFAFARIFPRSQPAAAMESRRTRDRGEAPARERSNVRFFPRSFPRALNDPSEALTAS